jgi:transcriptional regulator with XRE-family HTH domain
MVGERLRRIRQQKQWSLNEVESQSEGEFKASVLGAYERGERAISVPRLERLARFYGVAVDQLLPRDSSRVDAGNTSSPTAKLRIDVAKLSTMSGAQFEMLERFLRMIQVQRQDFNGKVITVRAHDTRAIAVMLDVPVDQVGERLGELGLLFIPPPQT